MNQIRQGDVFLFRVDALPKGAKEVQLEAGRIVLAHGEATGHAHAIADHAADGKKSINPALAKRLADEAIARAMRSAKARLYEHQGDRYLVVDEPVNLTHEEHSPLIIRPGIYEIPIQVEHTAEFARQVAD